MLTKESKRADNERVIYGAVPYYNTSIPSVLMSLKVKNIM